MLALIYLGSAIALGDLLSRRFYRFVSISHRWATAVLVGIFLSTWFTYLAGLAFAHTGEALLFADLLFFATAAGAIFWLSRKAPKVRYDCAARGGIVGVGLGYARRAVCCGVRSADRNALCQ